MNLRTEEQIPLPAAATAGGEHTSSKTRLNDVYSRSTALGKARASGANSVMYRSNCGQEWRHTGNAGRVLGMLASIQVLRDSGLEIETTREGDFRHGHYRLLTKGALVERPDAKEFGL